MLNVRFFTGKGHVGNGSKGGNWCRQKMNCERNLEKVPLSIWTDGPLFESYFSEYPQKTEYLPPAL